MTEIVHTASANVRIIDPAFYIPQLHRTRRIWLFLPEGYVKSKKKYPVLYMHDGQNLFDAATSFSGEWEIDKTLNTFPDPCIVVGIDNGGALRMNEYNPFDTHQFGKGEGRAYLEFIVKTLKPFIDKNYRTLRRTEDTYIAGSSMGGLISFYAGIFYPKLFGRIGIFSPSFWAAPDIEAILKSLKPKKLSDQHYYFYGGGAENATMISDILKVMDLIQKYARPEIEVVIKPGGYHSEDCWRQEFPAFYQWLSR